MEDITYADCAHSKNVCKGFEIKKLGEYHDLYIQSNTLLLADVFGNFRDMCFKIYELDPEKLLLAPVAYDRRRYKIRNMSLYLSICKS